MASLLNRLWSQADFWDRDENRRQRQQQSQPKLQPQRQGDYKYSPLAQRDSEQRAFETYTQQFRQGKINQNRYNALIKSLGRKEALYNDVPKAWTDQYRSGKISEQRYDALLKQQVGRKAPQAEGINAFTRVTAPIALGAMRGATGIAQGVSGLYDLLSPGEGTNRFSNNLDTLAKATDHLVDSTGLSKSAYFGSQVATNLLPLAAGTKAAQVASHGTKAGNLAGRYNAAVTSRLAPAVQQGFTRAGMPTIGRVAAYGTRNGLQASDLIQDAAITASQVGQDASKGIEITPQRVALEAGMIGLGNPAASALMGGTARLAGAGARQLSNVPKAVSKTVKDQTAKRAMQKAGQTLAQNPNDRAIYEGLYRLHTNPNAIPDQQKNFLLAAGRQLDQKYGIDTSISGTRNDFKARIESLIDESMKPPRRSVWSDEMGAVGRNIRQDDPLEALKAEARSLRNSGKLGRLDDGLLRDQIAHAEKGEPHELEKYINSIKKSIERQDAEYIRRQKIIDDQLEAKAKNDQRSVAELKAEVKKLEREYQKHSRAYQNVEMGNRKNFTGAQTAHDAKRDGVARQIAQLEGIIEVKERMTATPKEIYSRPVPKALDDAIENALDATKKGRDGGYNNPGYAIDAKRYTDLVQLKRSLQRRDISEGEALSSIETIQADNTPVRTATNLAPSSKAEQATTPVQKPKITDQQIHDMNPYNIDRTKLSGRQLDMTNQQLAGESPIAGQSQSPTARPQRTATGSVDSSSQTAGRQARQSSAEFDQAPTQPVSSQESGSQYSHSYNDYIKDAFTRGSRSQKASKLENLVNKDQAINDAAKRAQETGSEIHFFAKNDPNNRSVGVERFDPSTHRIEAGFVVDDNTGRVLGNHIKVDPTGIQVNVGGDIINMNQVLGDTTRWKGRYELSSTMSRNIDRNAPTPETARRTKEFLVGHKTQAEARFRTELETEYKNLASRKKAVESTRPRGTSKKEFNKDVFDLLDGKKTDADIRKAYGDETANAIQQYKQETRQLYDSLLDRINAERVKFGMPEVPKRKNYITHLTELGNSRSFVGDVKNTIRNSFTDEGMQTTRGAVPDSIAGRTEGFRPKAAYNRFLQRRTGAKALEDPFKAVEEYLEPALYNIHMTESGVRARAIESAFRTASELRNMSTDDIAKKTSEFLEHYRGSADTAKLTTGFQEYANALARKTQRWDRQVTDSSDAASKALRGWQGLQRVGGRATILGNVSSTLAQPLNQVITLADAGPINYMRGIASNLAGDKAIKQSAFIKARSTKASAPLRSNFTKTMDVMGVPLEAVELASVKNTWYAMYAKAQKAGLKGRQAIQKADFDTERLVAGRGVADRPEVYRSSLASGLLQFTLEVNAQNKAFWRDLSTTQKATFLAAAMGVNTVYEKVSGQSPLPDFLGSAIDTFQSLGDSEDERSTAGKLIDGAKAQAGEVVGMNPLTSAAANALLTQSQRKALFGADSDLGRFEGTAAPVQVIKNAYGAVESTIEGNLADARNKALRLVPGGNQARKTITGAEANSRGYAVDRSGNPTFATSTSPYSQVQNLLFGPSSTSEARDHYDNNRRPLSQKQAEAVRSSSDPRAEVQKIQEQRSIRREGQIAITDKTEKTSSGDYVSRDKYDALIHAYSKQGGEVQTSKYDTNELKAAVRDMSEEFKGISNKYGLPEVKLNTNTAKEYAKFVKGDYKGLEVAGKERDLVRKIYKSQISKDARTLLGLSARDIKNAISNKQISNQMMQEAIALDNLLYDKGINSQLMIGKTLREDLGIGLPSTYGSKSGSGSGSKNRTTLNELVNVARGAPGVPRTGQITSSGMPTPSRFNAPRIQRVSSAPKSAPQISVRSGLV